MASDFNITEERFAGHAVVGKTAYRVYRLPANLECGIEARFALVGPRGSHVFVTDYGKGFNLNAVCLGGGRSWQAQPRQMRGLTREHLSLFYAEAGR